MSIEKFNTFQENCPNGIFGFNTRTILVNMLLNTKIKVFFHTNHIQNFTMSTFSSLRIKIQYCNSLSVEKIIWYLLNFNCNFTIDFIIKCGTYIHYITLWHKYEIGVLWVLFISHWNNKPQLDILHTKYLHTHTYHSICMK